MKKCKKCGLEKDISEFYKNPKSKDGYQEKCKECAKKMANENRRKNIDRIREYDRTRGNRQDSSYLKERRKKYPKAYRFYNIIAHHLRVGNILKKPCEVCGTTENVVAHHDDYNHALEIRWLCQSHHLQWHEENGEGKNLE